MIIPIIATIMSILSRFIFIYLIYKNRSKNSISLLFSITSLISGSLWLFYFIMNENNLLMVRTIVELLSSFFSCLYIIYNKFNIE
jgi:lipid-A-disaccharide synthase-like uncharacterized protein